MHKDSNKKPNVFKSVLKYSGDKPNDATAIEGSIRFRLGFDLITVFDLIAGHHASMSSII